MTPQSIIQEAVEKNIQIAERYYQRTFNRPKRYVYKTTGTTLGYCKYGCSELMFNLFYYHQNPTQYLSTTVPHEVAHWIDIELHGLNRKNGRWDLHPNSWKTIMVNVFKLPPKVTNDQKYVVPTTRITKKYPYTCNCENVTHCMSSQIHNKILSGRNFVCTNCRGKLKYAHQPTVEFLKNEIKRHTRLMETLKIKSEVHKFL